MGELTTDIPRAWLFGFDKSPQADVDSRGVTTGGEQL
jgi:hypothetical protein